MKNFLLFLFLVIWINIHAQVAITSDGSSPDNSSMLDIKSTSKGMLLPRMTQSQRDAITSPATGLTVFQTDNTPGIYFNSGTPGSPVWVMAGNGVSWSLNGNSGTIAGTNFLGTTDNVPLTFKVYNELAGKIDHLLFNTSLGYHALASLTTGFYNTAIGFQALFSNNSSGNTAMGYQALYSNNPGTENSAMGRDALYNNTGGNYNVGIGSYSLYGNTTGSQNSAVGISALSSNTKGTANIAIGLNSLYNNSTAGQNIAIGVNALQTQSFDNSNTAWTSNNVAVGYEALFSNQPYSNGTGINNTAIGNFALYINTSGISNVAAGYYALSSNTSGYYNTAIGQDALSYISTGSYNTGVGNNAYPTINPIDNWTGLGFNVGGSTSISNSVEIGNSSVTRIQGQVSFTTYSDGRVKDNVMANVPGLDFILKLRPVTYNLNIHRQNELMNGSKKENADWPGKYDIEKIRMTGFIAQEVELASEEISYDFSGVVKPQTNDGLYGLRYSDFVVPLVKAVQEQQNMIEAQKAAVEQLKSENIELKADNAALEERLMAVENKLSGK